MQTGIQKAKQKELERAKRGGDDSDSDDDGGNMSKEEEAEMMRIMKGGKAGAVSESRKKGILTQCACMRNSLFCTQIKTDTKNHCFLPSLFSVGHICE